MSENTIEELLAQRDWLEDLVRRLVSDPGTADDIVQETCLKALHRPPGHLRGIRGWLATVARNLVTDGHRRRAREDRRDQQVPTDRYAPDASDVVARVEAEREIARLVLELPEPYRTTLLLRYWRGLGAAEIGRETGTPAGTVRSRLSRGHRMLRERLDRRREGDRRAWVLGLLPLLKPKPVEGPVAMPIALKIAAALLLVICAGIGTSLILANPSSEPTPVASSGDEGERHEIVAQADPEDESDPPKEPERPETGDVGTGKSAALPDTTDPLDRQVSFAFADAPLTEALEFIGRLKGLRFEFGPDVHESTVTLSAQALTLRAAIDLLTRLAGCRWDQRADGTIVVRRDPSLTDPEPPKRRVPEIAPSSPPVSPPDPIRPVEPPPIELEGNSKAEPIPLDVLGTAIEIVVDRKGIRYLRLRPDGRFERTITEYAFWLRLGDLAASFESPMAPPILLRFDRRAPHSRTRWTHWHLRSLGRLTGDVWKVGGGTADAPAGVRQSPRGGMAGPDGEARVRLRFPFASRPGHRNLKAMGGSRFTERGVDLGLRWLAEAQESDGSWLSGADPVEATALALLAFLGAGETPARGRYRENVRRGLDWLETRQDETGRVGGGPSAGHATATIALAEAFAMTHGDAERHRPAQRAVDHIQTQELDLTSIHALTIARISGLTVDVARLTAAVRSLGDEAPLERSVGVLDRIFVGDTVDRAECGKELLLRPPSQAGTEGMLHWLAAGDAAFQIGGETWKAWNKVMKETLLPLQRAGRAEVGSFDPVGSKAIAGGRVVSTALAVLCLEVYYRYDTLKPPGAE